MLISLDKAVEILMKGSHVIIQTRDGKLAIVPEDKASLQVTSMEAINLMFYVIRQSAGDTFESLNAQLDELLEKAKEEASKPDPTELRAQRYREIRGLT